ncbi:MAG: hypothetical protein EPN93_07430 [Spirochaetes bacterium]|nr:MAG: hypothetical protein EPN93_07430 [Spirochaetota bacterium]
MMFTRIVMIGALALCTAFVACSNGGKLGGFQKNEPDPDFQLFSVMDGYGNIKDLFGDLDMNDVITNDLPAAISANYDEFNTMSKVLKDLATHEDRPLIDLMTSLRSLLSILEDSERHHAKSEVDSFYETAGVNYHQGFYELLNDLSKTDGLTEDGIEILKKSIDYIADENGYDLDEPEGVRDLVQKLIDKIDGMDVQDIRDASGIIAKLTIQNDTPMFIDNSGNLILNSRDISAGDTNLDLGNAVRGTHSLLRALNDMLVSDGSVREMLYQSDDSIMKHDLPRLVDPAHAPVYKNLLVNMERYFTEGGANFNADYKNSDPYVNAEIKNTAREVLPFLIQLFIRDKATGEPAGIPDYSIIHDHGLGKSPVELLTRALDKLRNAGIDFDTYAIEPSLKRMMQYGADGNLRTASSYKVSYLEHLIFTLIASYQYGYKTRMSTSGEPVDDNYSRGHGEATHGIISVNDTMYSLRTGETFGLNSYGLALNVRKSSQAPQIGRSADPFTSFQRTNHMFFMGYDFPTLGLLPGTCAGDAGLPNGGETVEYVRHGLDGDGKPIMEPVATIQDATNDEDYKTYYPQVVSGRGVLNTACWLMGWIARACWEGEGPYYYADPAAESVYLDYDGNGSSEQFFIYKKLNGDVYALVHKPSADPATWVYLYPTNAYDAEERLSGGQFLNLSGTSIDEALYKSRGTRVKPGSVELTCMTTTEVTGEDLNNSDTHVSDTLAHAPVIPGSLMKIHLKEDTWWFPEETDIYITCDTEGAISGENINTSYSATINYDTGAVNFYISGISWDIGDVTLTSYRYGLDPTTASDDGAGHITGPAVSGTGTINYGTGAIQCTVTAGSGDRVVLCTWDRDTAYNGKRERANRYKATWRSDYYIVNRGHLAESTVPPMNERGWTYVEGTTGENKFKLNSSGSYLRSEYFTFNEKIREEEAMRACASQEEALFRNFQWVVLEKKFIFIIPMHIWATVLTCQVHSAAFILVDCNGALGITNAKKGPANGQWMSNLPASQGGWSSGIGEGDISTGRTPDYRESSQPGDARILVFCREHEIALGQGIFVDTIFNDILGGGYVLPDIVGRNIGPITRMGFLQNAMVASNATGTPWNNAWAIRSRLLPVFAALVGAVHEKSLYTPAAGHDYNFAGPHKNPIQGLYEGLVMPLAKPYFRRLSDSGGRWAPRINDSAEGALTYLTPSAEASVDYRPRSNLRTMVSLLVENDNTTAGCDGLLPLVADNTSIVSKLLALLQKIGDNDAGSPYRLDEKAIRKNLFYSLEQILTSIKLTKGELVTKEESGESTPVYGDDQYTHLDYTNYQWMFKPSMRAEDFDLDWALTKLVDDRLAQVDTWTQDPDWDEFEDGLETLSSFLDKTKPAGNPGKYYITGHLAKIIDTLFAEKTYTDDEFAGLLYTLGKYVAWYDRGNNKWLYQGDEGFNDLVVLLKELLPKMHSIVKDDTGQNYYDMKVLLKAMNEDGGLIAKLGDKMIAPDTPEKWEVLINELSIFLADDAVGGSGSLWFELSDMFEDLLAMETASMSAAEKVEYYKQFYRQYGFQFNGF